MCTGKRPRAAAEPPATELASAVAEARDEIARTDVKAGTLLTLATGALAGLLTFAHSRIPVPAAVVLWLAAALTTAALAVLLAVVRPCLSGVPRDGIFPDGERLIAAGPVSPADWHIHRLRLFAALAVRKHRRVRLAVDLLTAALIALAAAAVLAAWGA